MSERMKGWAKFWLPFLAWGALIYTVAGAMLGLKRLPNAIERASDIYLCVEAVKLYLHPPVCDGLLNPEAS